MYFSKEIQAKLLYSPTPFLFPEVATINWLVHAIPDYCLCVYKYTASVFVCFK